MASVRKRSSDQVVISQPNVNSDAAELMFDIAGLSQPCLRFETTREFVSFLPQTSEAALMGLLVPAMAAGKNIVVSGRVSETLVFNIEKNIIPLLLRTMPGLMGIDIVAPDKVETKLTGAPAVLTGLSNGIDSLCTCADFLLGDAPKSMRLTHFLFCNIGSHGAASREKSRALFEDRLAAVRSAAAGFQLPVIPVTSNLDAFYESHSFQQTHTYRNASAALALGSRAANYLYSSGISYAGIAVRPDAGDPAYIDPLLLPLIRTETLQCHPVGTGYTRVEKTDIVADLDVARHHLDVCAKTWPNCSICWKCARTLFTAELLGKADNLSQVLDRAKFSPRRDGYAAHILLTARHSSLSREIRELMQSSGFSVKPRHLAIAAVGFLPHRLFRAGVPKMHGLYRRITGFPPDH